MTRRHSSILQRHVFREILVSSFCCSALLALVLLYGNLMKHDEDLFRALAIEPSVFLELVLLMVPFALSLGLSFGFSLAVVFCLGRWSSDKELMAMQSLGMNPRLWLAPISWCALGISLASLLASLHWAPLARSKFEQRIREVLLEDFYAWSRSGRELAIELDSDAKENLIQGMGSSEFSSITHASINIGGGLGANWKNVRVALGNEENQVQAIMHAKEGLAEIDRRNGRVELILSAVDFESLTTGSKNVRFLSFEKWKQPLVFRLWSADHDKKPGRISIMSFLGEDSDESISEAHKQQYWRHYNKYGSLACAPISLFPILSFLAVCKGRRESHSNLFLGVSICLLYFLFGMALGDLFGSKGFGWWISFSLTLGAGLFLQKDKLIDVKFN